MAAPSEPTLSVSNDGDGDAVTATIDGDAGVTNRILYRTGEDAAWTSGGTRSGDGTIQVTGLSESEAYHFVVQSEDAGYYSRPSNLIALKVVNSATTSATGPLTQSKDALIELLAACAAFQDWVGATGDAAAKIAFAKTRIHRDIVVGSPSRPFAWIGNQIPAEWRDYGVAGGGRTRFLGEGTLGILLEDDADATAPNESVQFRIFERTVDSIIVDIEALAGTGGYLIGRNVRVLDGPGRVEDTKTPSDAGLFQALLGVDWGGGGP